MSARARTYTQPKTQRMAWNYGLLRTENLFKETKHYLSIEWKSFAMAQEKNKCSESECERRPMHKTAKILEILIEKCMVSHLWLLGCCW